MHQKAAVMQQKAAVNAAVRQDPKMRAIVTRQAHRTVDKPVDNLWTKMIVVQELSRSCAGVVEELRRSCA